MLPVLWNVYFDADWSLESVTYFEDGMVVAVFLFTFFAQIVGWADNTLVSSSADGENIADIASDLMWEKIVFNEFISDRLLDLFGNWRFFGVGLFL